MEIQNLKVDVQCSDRLWLQLANRIEQAIKQGRLNADTKLPPIMAISRTASVSKHTVYRAYRHLRKKGIVYWVKSEGFFLNDQRYVQPICSNYNRIKYPNISVPKILHKTLITSS